MLRCCLLPQIPKLTEGREYIMRIFAENMYGISDPLESEEMKAKDLFSMFLPPSYFRASHKPFKSDKQHSPVVWFYNIFYSSNVFFSFHH